MIVRQIEQLLNDQEVNYIADLYLSCFGFDMSSKRYRLFRNAVILFSHDAFKPKQIYEFLGELVGKSAAYAENELQSAIYSLDHPIYETFNDCYGKTEGNQRRPRMEKRFDASYVLGFLGVTLMYIILTDYNRLYEYIDYKPVP